MASQFSTAQLTPTLSGTLRMQAAQMRALGATHECVSSSAKLQLLGRVLTVLRRQGKRALLLSHTSKV